MHGVRHNERALGLQQLGPLGEEAHVKCNPTNGYFASLGSHPSTRRKKLCSPLIIAILDLFVKIGEFWKMSGESGSIKDLARNRTVTIIAKNEH